MTYETLIKPPGSSVRLSVFHGLRFLLDLNQAIRSTSEPDSRRSRAHTTLEPHGPTLSSTVFGISSMLSDESVRRTRPLSTSAAGPISYTKFSTRKDDVVSTLGLASDPSRLDQHFERDLGQRAILVGYRKVL